MAAIAFAMMKLYSDIDGTSTEQGQPRRSPMGPSAPFCSGDCRGPGRGCLTWHALIPMAAATTVRFVQGRAATVKYVSSGKRLPQCATLQRFDVSFPVGGRSISWRWNVIDHVI